MNDRPLSSQQKFQKTLMSVTILSFLALSILYSICTPIFESQDEEHHFSYISYFANHMQLLDYANVEGLKAIGGQAHQTPLYYFVQSLLLKASGYQHAALTYEENPFKSSGMPALYLHNMPGERFPYFGEFRIFHLLRLTNIIAGLLTLLVIYKTAQLMPFRDENFPIVAAAFVALIPQFTYLCGTLTNDVFYILFSSIGFFFLMKFILSPAGSRRYAIYLSVAVGLAVLSKQMALSFLPPLYLTVLVKGNRRRKIENGIAVTLALAVVIGWYYGRNWLLFRDPFAVKALNTVCPNLIQQKSISQMFSYVPNYFIRIFVSSFWGSFGYMNVQLSWLSYFFYNVLAGAGIVAFATGMMDEDFRTRFSKQQKLILVLLIVAFAFLLIEILSFNMLQSQPQGRYLFGWLGCLAVFWGLGMDRMISGRQRHKNIFCLSLVLLLVVVNLQIINGTLSRAFPAVPTYIDGVRRKPDGNLGELTKGNVVGQTFYCNSDGLNTVSVFMTTFGRYNNCHIVFHLRDLSRPAIDVATQEIPAIQIEDNTYYFFTFPPLKDSSAHNYLFLLESPDATHGQAVGCFYIREDSYPGGNAILNNRVLKGDIAFLAGCD